MAFDYSSSESPWITVESFGFARGVPQSTTGCLLIDLRGVPLDDPADEPGLRGRDGTDADAVQHVLASPRAFTVLERACDQARALLDANAARNLRLRVLVGDEDGQRRAVVVADALAEILTGRGLPADVVHHHLPAPARG
ncbi:hypothetical protein NX794_33175 [Streptomyces sp. LP11]|uniref:RapZ C-terminal domain-containing protein n=1 Tax=Streptomyces pyxinicus TaxID=2970331 RepID=A0ABT2BBY6_9ACTN|nr:RNase adapter RapZ [Streptomyces sp. LP11]MCS0606025.1 hypothetical protein [Streptomyces sp. LP11]